MIFRQKLLEFYWAMERRLAPGLQYSQHRYEEHLHRWIPDGVDWLDVGCGRRLLPDWRVEAERRLLAKAKSLVGVDLDLGSLKDNTTASFRVFSPVERLPFRDNAFDIVTANMVVEHLEDPAASFVEIARVLRPGGLYLFHTPNANAFPTALARVIPDAVKAPLARLLDGRTRGDVFQTHYRCNTSAGIAECSAAAGLTCIELSFVSTTAISSIVPPVAFFELLWLRNIQRPEKRHLRSNLIAVLQKPLSTAS